MSARKLFLCNNPYQIIVSILLKECCENDSCIAITDNFVGAENIAKNLKAYSSFSNVFYFPIHEFLFPKNTLSRLKKFLFAISEGRRFFEKILGKTTFNELCYNNDDVFLYSLVRYLERNDKQLKVFRFEEGYSSYFRMFCSPKAKKIFDIRHHRFEDVLEGMYFFEPTYLQYDCPIKINRITNNFTDNVRKMIKMIFAIDDSFDYLDNKWVIFEESFYTDYGYNDDIQLYKNIIEYLGSDKVVVKLHPRTRVNRFKDLNVQIMESKGIPWEALAIACNFNNIKMLTLASGSVINSRLMLGDSSKALMLYKCVDSSIPSIGKKFDMFMNSFLKNHSNELIIPNSINELRCQIDKIRENELG